VSWHIRELSSYPAVLRPC